MPDGVQMYVTSAALLHVMLCFVMWHHVVTCTFPLTQPGTPSAGPKLESLPKASGTLCPLLAL